MENASKALLMAAGILIAILVIALLARTFNNMNMFQRAQLTEEEQQQLIAFNEQYTKYLSQYVYGTEVLTVKNKSENNGIVTVNIDGELPDKSENKHTYDKNTNAYSNETRYYKCTNITYDSTGRVNSITFKQIKMNSKAEI